MLHIAIHKALEQYLGAAQPTKVLTLDNLHWRAINHGVAKVKRCFKLHADTGYWEAKRGAETGCRPMPAGRVPIMARRLTISRGKLALEDATAAIAPNIMVMCGGTESLPVFWNSITNFRSCCPSIVESCHKQSMRSQTPCNALVQQNVKVSTGALRMSGQEVVPTFL